MAHPMLELQEECINYTDNAISIIRKAYAYARKLKLQEMTTWLDLEMKGYDRPSNVPKYRVVHGIIKALSVSGLIPVQLPSDILGSVSKHGIAQPISEINTIVGNNNGEVYLPFQGDVNEALCNAIGMETQIYLVVSKEQLKSIIDFVIDSILKWTLLFEEENIIGDELTFSESDAERAKTVPLEKYCPIIFNGNIDNVQIQNDTIKSNQIIKKND